MYEEQEEEEESLQSFVMMRTSAECTITDHTTPAMFPHEVSRRKGNEAASSLSATCAELLALFLFSVELKVC